uniref:Uncharacterized protein n=1 Tax=Fagus sylvatica TaxID=28930 RepID=A0A2N9I5L8_FAGSY
MLVRRQIAPPLRWRTALTSSESSKLFRFCSTPENRPPLAGAEETSLSPRRKTPKPDGIYSLSPSLFLLPHQLTALPPIVTCRGRLGVSQSEFGIRVWVERPSQGPNSLAYAEEFL